MKKSRQLIKRTSNELMKGHRNFTKTDELELIRLITLLEKANRTAQKAIRAKMRRMHFHIRDFTSSNKGFTVSDFQTLKASKEVVIS